MKKFKNIFDFINLGNLQTQNFVDISFNDKMGDQILFGFSKLPIVKKKFRNVYVFSQFTKILAQDKYQLVQIDFSKLTYDEILKQIKIELRKIPYPVTVFLDGGSIRNYAEKTCSDENINEVALNYLLKIQELFDELDINYLIWRNPFFKSYLGSQSFTFAYNSNEFFDVFEFDEIILKSAQDQEFNVYKVSRFWTKSTFGIETTPHLLEHDLSNLDPVSNGFKPGIIININTGDELKRKTLEVRGVEFLKYLINELKSHKIPIYFAKLEQTWAKHIQAYCNKLVDDYELKEFSFNEVGLNFYKESLAAISLCSGFVHYYYLLNPRIISFFLENTNNDIDGVNPWAPGLSLCLNEDTSLHHAFAIAANEAVIQIIS